MPARSLFALSILLALLIGLPVSSAQACTVWAAIDPAPDGAVLIAKIRDEDPDQTQEIRAFHPSKGYAYFGLLGESDGKRSFVGGVNEKGLTIFSLTASVIPRSERVPAQGGKGAKGGVGENVLRSCADLKEVEAGAARFFTGKSPRFYLLADRSRAAWLEIAPDGAYSFRPIGQGTIAHTNHYLDPSLAAQTPAAGKSSAARLARIQALLAEHPCPFSLDEFKRFAQDRNAGPNDSLFRTGKKTRTLAFFFVRIPKQGGPPFVSIELFTPGQEGERAEGLLPELLKQP
jgi:hypothetical protein